MQRIELYITQTSEVYEAGHVIEVRAGRVVQLLYSSAIPGKPLEATNSNMKILLRGGGGGRAELLCESNTKQTRQSICYNHIQYSLSGTSKSRDVRQKLLIERDTAWILPSPWDPSSRVRRR